MLCTSSYVLVISCFRIMGTVMVWYLLQYCNISAAVSCRRRWQLPRLDESFIEEVPRAENVMNHLPCYWQKQRPDVSFTCCKTTLTVLQLWMHISWLVQCPWEGNGALWYVCVCVCVSVCLDTYLRNHWTQIKFLWVHSSVHGAVKCHHTNDIILS